jgi:hypothetical protein
MSRFEHPAAFRGLARPTSAEGSRAAPSLPHRLDAKELFRARHRTMRSRFLGPPGVSVSRDTEPCQVLPNGFISTVSHSWCEARLDLPGPRGRCDEVGVRDGPPPRGPRHSVRTARKRTSRTGCSLRWLGCLGGDPWSGCRRPVFRVLWNLCQ